LCSRTRPVSVLPTKVSLPFKLMGLPETDDVQPVLRSRLARAQKETHTAQTRP
jgi:hypothetical protein